MGGNMQTDYSNWLKLRSYYYYFFLFVEGAPSLAQGLEIYIYIFWVIELCGQSTDNMVWISNIFQRQPQKKSSPID